MWIIIGLGVIVLAILGVFFFPWRLGEDHRDLGTISHRWLAAHRNHTP